MRVFRSRGVVGLSFVPLTIFALAALAGAQPAPPAPAADPAAAPAPPAPAPSTAPAPAAAPAPSGAAGPADAGAYNVRLRSHERSVNELKEQVFRIKARMNLLKETVLGGVIGASRCIIRHKNEMGSSFRLIRAVYALDGVQILSKADDSGRLAEMTDFDIYNGAIQPGSHTLTVQLVYQGHGYGVFSYLKGYKFTARASHTFVAGDGKATIVSVVGYEKGSIATNMEEKPDIDFRINVMAPESVGAAPKKK